MCMDVFVCYVHVFGVVRVCVCLCVFVCVCVCLFVCMFVVVRAPLLAFRQPRTVSLPPFLFLSHSLTHTHTHSLSLNEDYSNAAAPGGRVPLSSCGCVVGRGMDQASGGECAALRYLHRACRQASERVRVLCWLGFVVHSPMLTHTFCLC